MGETGPGDLLELRGLVGSRPLFAVGAGVLLEDAEGRLLLQRRSDDGLLGLPGGTAEPGETLPGCAARELAEETGWHLDPERLRPLATLSGPEYYFRYPNGDQVYYVSTLYRGKLADCSGGGSGDAETLELCWVEVSELTDPQLSGPVTRAGAHLLGARLPWPPAQPAPEGGETYSLSLRPLIGQRGLFAPGATAVLRSPSGKVLLQRRSDGGFGLPGGYCALGERLDLAAQRELREETGLSGGELRFLELQVGPRYWHRYPGGDLVYHANGLFAGRWPDERVPTPADHKSRSFGWFSREEWTGLPLSPLVRDALELAEGR